MKYIAAILGLVIWMLGTLIMALTIVPFLFLILMDDYWKIPLKLLKTFES